MTNVDAIERLIRTLVVPSRFEVLRAKRAIAAALSPGDPKHVTELKRAVLDADDVPVAEQHDERIVVSSPDDLEAVVTADHPILRRRRLLAAAAEALAELRAHGSVVPVDAARPSDTALPGLDGDRANHVHYQFQNYGSGVRVLDDAPRLDDGYKVTHRLRGDASLFLEADIFTADLEALNLNARSLRALEESLQCFRRGLFLAAASLLGAAVEGAWFAAAERLRRPNTKLDKELAKALPSTQEVQRLVSELLPARVRHELSSLTGLLREIRNYGVHPREDRGAVEVYLVEEACGRLILTAHRHLRLLQQATLEALDGS